MLIIATFLIDVGSTDRGYLRMRYLGNELCDQLALNCVFQTFVLFCFLFIFRLYLCIWCLHLSSSECHPELR